MGHENVLVAGEAQQDEFDAAEALAAGMLVERSAEEQVQAHTTADGQAAFRLVTEFPEVGVALENKEGEELSNPPSTLEYSTGQNVKTIQPEAGAKVLAIVSEDIASAGVPLASAGDGTLKSSINDGTEETGSIVAETVAAVSTGAGAATLAVVEAR